jgi:nitrogen regulatory protein PII
MKLVLFVLHEAGKLEEILEAWTAAGAQGVTILPSLGMSGVQQGRALGEDIPLMPSLEDFLPSNETISRTLFTVVRDDALVARIVEATQTITGDLNQPGTGILAVLPVGEGYGLDRI